MITIIRRNALHALRAQLVSKDSRMAELNTMLDERFQSTLAHLNTIDRLTAQVNAQAELNKVLVSDQQRAENEAEAARAEAHDIADQLVNVRESLSTARIATAVAETERDAVRDELNRSALATSHLRAKIDELMSTIVELRREGFNPPNTTPSEAEAVPDLAAEIVGALGTMYTPGSDIYRKEASYARSLLANPNNTPELVARMILRGAELEDITL